MPKRHEFTLRIRYRPGRGEVVQTRVIPWNWEPSTDDVFDAVRRLRSQCPGAAILGATLERTVLIKRYSIPETLDYGEN